MLMTTKTSKRQLSSVALASIVFAALYYTLSSLGSFVEVSFTITNHKSQGDIQEVLQNFLILMTWKFLHNDCQDNMESCELS